MKIDNVSNTISSAEYKVQETDSRKSTSNSEIHKVAKKTSNIENTGEQNDKEVDDEILIKSVNQANKSLKQYNRFIERTVHEVTKSVMYTVKDINTDEVIAEFPPRKIQDMVAKMWELAGLFVDEKA